MTSSRNGISTIIATILTISLAVMGSAVYYVAITSYMRPQAGLSLEASISAGASGFNVIDLQVVNTGGVPFALLSATISGSSSQLQITWSSPLSANGGTVTLTVRGLSGGPYTAVSSSTGVSGNLVVSAGSTYAVVVEGTTASGATYSQAFSVEASP